MCDVDGCSAEEDLQPLVVDPEKRRAFLKGLASLPLASVLAYPELARAAADKLASVSMTLDNGKTVSAALAVPEANRAPAVMLIHEWWGLNDQIKSVAAELAQQGYLALAVDLYHGSVATDSGGAKSLMHAVDAPEATQTLVAWNRWLRSHERSTGKLGTVGWCFGGGWSLNASIAAPVDATVIYYGNVAVKADKLRALKGPVLGHFATKDTWINADMVGQFEMQMSNAGKGGGLTVYWYEADHAFANPTSSRYDAADASLAWERTTAFFKRALA